MLLEARTAVMRLRGELTNHQRDNIALLKEHLDLVAEVADEVWNDDNFDVLANGEVVGRIFKVNAAHVGNPWMWT
jgi:hypothetical protein